MESLRIIWMAAIAAAAIFLGDAAALAQTRGQQLALDAADGSRITGFVLQDAAAAKDAPLAILMHGMTGSSLQWIAKDNATGGDAISAALVEQGYRVVALDARAHGVRKDDMAPAERLEHLRAGRSDAYLAMINGTLSDYDALLEEVKRQHGQPSRIIVIGYSMGAQMAVLFAAKHEEVAHIVTMVPPAVQRAPSVAPINHAARVRADWLLLTASQDQFASGADNDALALAAGGNLHRVEFDSRHMLPRNYVETVVNWIANIPTGVAAGR
jgi:dienelactone hydrolase